MRNRAILVAAATVVIATSAFTQTFTSTDTPFAITDNNTIMSTITVPVGTGTVVDLDVSLTADHTFIGDVTFTVTAPSGTMVNLVARPGRIGFNFGDFSDYDGTYVFDDDSPSRIIDSASLLAAGEAVPSESYHPTTTDDVLSFLSDFNGTTADGVWTLTVSDAAPFNTGELTEWSLIFISETSTTPPQVTPPTPARADLLIGKSFGRAKGNNTFNNRRASNSQTLVRKARIFTTNTQKAALLLQNDGGTAANMTLRSSGDRLPRMKVSARSGGRNVSAAVKAGRFSPTIAPRGSVKVSYKLKTNRFYAGVLRNGDRDDTIHFRLSGGGSRDNAAMRIKYSGPAGPPRMDEM